MNGGWSEWGPHEECSALCGGGIEKNLRLCNDPLPSNGGDECVGDATREIACNTQACPGYNYFNVT